MKASNIGVLATILALFVSCQEPASLPSDSKLPAILLGTGSATTAQSALYAASALSQDGTAWIAYDSLDGGTEYVRITGLPEQMSSPLYGRIEYMFVELTPDRFVVDDEVFGLKETLMHLKTYVDSCRLTESTPEIALGGRENVSGEALVVFLRHLNEIGIDRIVSFGQPHLLPNSPPFNANRLLDDVTKSEDGEPDAAEQPATRPLSK